MSEEKKIIVNGEPQSAPVAKVKLRDFGKRIADVVPEGRDAQKSR